VAPMIKGTTVVHEFRRRRGKPVAGASPLLAHPSAMLRERNAKRLEQVGNRPVQAVAECQSECKATSAAQIQLGEERDIAVVRSRKFVFYFESTCNVLPSIACADVSAGAAEKRYVSGQGQPGVFLVRAQK
jgi:hypothetical protein